MLIEIGRSKEQTASSAHTGGVGVPPREDYHLILGGGARSAHSGRISIPSRISLRCTTDVKVLLCSAAQGN